MVETIQHKLQEFDPGTQPHTKLNPREATTIAIVATDAQLTQARVDAVHSAVKAEAL